MSEPTLAAGSRKPFDPERALSAFRPSLSLIAAVVLCLLPVFLSVGANLQLSATSAIAGHAQNDAAGFLFPFAAVLVAGYAITEVCAGAVRGPRFVHAALILPVLGFALFQLSRALAEL